MQISQWAKKIIVSSLSPFAITSLSFAAWFAPFYEFATLYVAGNATSMNTGSWFMPKVNNLVNRIYLIVQFVFPPTGTVVASFRQLRSTRWLLPVTTARTKRWWLTLKTLPTPFIRIRLWPLDRQECCATLSMLIHVVSTRRMRRRSNTTVSCVFGLFAAVRATTLISRYSYVVLVFFFCPERLAFQETLLVKQTLEKNSERCHNQLWNVRKRQTESRTESECQVWVLVSPNFFIWTLPQVKASSRWLPS